MHWSYIFLAQSHQHIHGFLQDCGNSSMSAMELPQSCTKPLMHYIPLNMRIVHTLLCFVVVWFRSVYVYPSGLLHRHCGNHTIAPMPVKQTWIKWVMQYHYSTRYWWHNHGKTKHNKAKYISYGIYCVRPWIHKKHPISHPHGQAMSVYCLERNSDFELTTDTHILS